MTGKIIKGISGLYSVHAGEAGVYECSARGILRYKNEKPLIGDDVDFDITDEQERRGNISSIRERKNSLVRPAVANIDMAVVVFAVKNPAPALNLLDRFLVMMESENITPVICFSKADLLEEDGIYRTAAVYEKAGYETVILSSKTGQGIDRLRSMMRGKTTALAGPSGVGKSTLTNELVPDAKMETGDISRKIMRGKHTTRHTEIFCVEKDTYVYDTPGFSSIYAWALTCDELKGYFPEFRRFEGQCRFNGCLHDREPGCMVKQALESGEISRGRYENYIVMLEEIKNRKKY